jgi:hypothetical protein
VDGAARGPTMPLSTAARLRAFALLLVVLVASAACDGEPEPEPPKPEVLADISMVSFEATAYFDAGANNARIIERIRREKESVVFALRRQQISVNTRKKLDVELKRVIREPVSVVDPAGGARRPALRVRYWFVGFGEVPAEMLKLSDVPFGLLHTDDPSKEQALAACLVDDAEGKPIWRRFDPSRESCKKAIDEEQQAIAAAREQVNAKDQEIIAPELDRLYVPISLHVTSRMERAKKVAAVDAGGEVDINIQGAVRTKPTPGIDPPSDTDPSPSSRVGSLIDRLRERAQAEEQAEEEDEARGVRPPSFVVAGGRSGGPDNLDAPGAFIFREPNFILLWGIALIMVIIAAVEFRRRRRRREIPARQERRRQRR